MKMIERITKKEKEVQDLKVTKFLYNTFFGRIILKLITQKWISIIVGKYMNSPFSVGIIKKTIIKNNIDMRDYEDKKYKSYNEFFTRKKKQINIDYNKKSFISPCDSKLMVFKIDKNLNLKIKNSLYSLKDIVNDKIVDEYENGYALVFRLEVTDYHHYIFIDDGTREEHKYINGILHTVQPIAYDKKVFHTNCREWTILHTENFQDLIEVEVGAMLVGKISNNSKNSFKKGDEKGYFEFGGSTIIVFVKNNIINIDEDIIENSKNGNETIVHCGEKIGSKI